MGVATTLNVYSLNSAVVLQILGCLILEGHHGSRDDSSSSDELPQSSRPTLCLFLVIAMYLQGHFMPISRLKRIQVLSAAGPLMLCLPFSQPLALSGFSIYKT